jgi:TolB-like protein/DNA-binding winged helix-turn-helix (wHTH) protein
MVRQNRQIFEFGPFRLIPEERQLLRDNQPVPLTPKSFDLLVVLVENSGRLIGKDALMEQIWPDSFVEEANLSVKMSALRRALGENPHEVQYIETVPRRGYRFVADVKERCDNGTESSNEEQIREGDDQSVVHDERRTLTLPSYARVFFRRWEAVLAGLLLISALLLALNPGGLRDRLSGKANPVNIQSLAVLPLNNLSGDASQDYFADGMTEALITDLAQVRSLKVISRTSVMQYKGAPKTLPEIARELNVDAIVEGSVLRYGDRVRITVQLIHAPADRHLWSETYERDLRDILALQSEIARTITQEIQVKLTPQEQVGLTGTRQISPEAYDYFLRGRFYANRQNRGDNETTIEMFERAVAADPGFAAAHAALAQAYVWRFFLFTPDEKQWEEKAFMEVEKALALDSNLGEAHLARGRLLWTPTNHFPHDKAIQEYRRALDLDPSLDEARNQLALVYGHVGLLDEALGELQKAVATNPSNSLAQFRIGETFLFQGKYEQALSALRNIPGEANPSLVGYQSVWALFNLGRKDEAAIVLEQFLKEHPEDNRGLFTSLQAVFAASEGHERLAEDKIKLAIEKGKGFGHFHHTAYHIASAYALMHKPEQAIKWLEAAADVGFPCYPLFERDANLDNLRQDARFVAFLAKQRRQWEYYKSI